MHQNCKFLFVGSKERLKRKIEKHEGTVLDQCRFRLVWRSSYFRRGLSFQIKGNYEKTGNGYLLRYRFVPTAMTILWVSIPMLICIAFAFHFLIASNADAAGALLLFSLLYPTIALWQAVSCHKQFRKDFEIATG